LNLNNYILFSPIGTSDPVRGGFDGSMLHIVRYYMPKKVHLYYSEDMRIRDDEDDKSKEAIHYLNPHIEVEKFFGDAPPYDFDSFIIEFNRIINEISNSNPEAEILLNISSGTPQMKSTLCLEAVTSNKKIKAIQVLTPTAGPNVDKPELERNRDIKEIMDNNLDSLEEATNRCNEPQIMSFRKSMIKSQIKSLVDIYDYEGAYRLLNEFDNQSLKMLINHCRLRLNLQYSEALKEIKEFNGTSLFPIHESSIARIVEYFLVLKIKQRKGQLTDMVLNLNPFIIELMEDYLRIILKVNMKKFYDIRRRSKAQVNEVNVDKVKSQDPKFYKQLTQAFKGGFREGSIVSVDFLSIAISHYRSEGMIEDIDFFNKMAEINQYLRNTSAHSLKAVTENDIKDISEMTSNKIISRIEGILKKIYGNKLPERALEIYDELNSYITEELNKY